MINSRAPGCNAICAPVQIPHSLDDRRRSARRMNARPALAVALLLSCSTPWAQESVPPDVPVQENAPDSSPAGITVAPGLTISGYATIQLLAPLGSGTAPPAALGS